ncbi:MAG: response regulator [Candidatus Omnitrophota bacterium]
MSGDKRTILVVEDDPLSMRLTVDLLQANGFNTLDCRDGTAALETLKASSPDMILLDINMPGMSGFEVHEKIRQDRRFDGIKVIALSASVMKEEEDRIRKAGFSDFVPKPLDTKGLVRKIKEYLGE